MAGWKRRIIRRIQIRSDRHASAWRRNREARRVKKLLIILAVIVAVVGTGALAWWRSLPPAPSDLDVVDPLVANAMRSALREARWRPWDVHAWRNLGLVYEANEAPELAAQCYLHVLESRPEDARTCYRLACAT